MKWFPTCIVAYNVVHNAYRSPTTLACNHVLPPIACNTNLPRETDRCCHLRDMEYNCDLNTDPVAMASGKSRNSAEFPTDFSEA